MQTLGKIVVWESDWVVTDRDILVSGIFAISNTVLAVLMAIFGSTIIIDPPSMKAMGDVLFCSLYFIILALLILQQWVMARKHRSGNNIITSALLGLCLLAPWFLFVGLEPLVVVIYFPPVLYAMFALVRILDGYSPT
jgi:hypothetical protein